MAIGTSQGAFYEDQFHYSQSQWDPKYDDNEITPNKQRTDKALEGAELDPSTGLGIEISDKKSQAAADSFKGGYLGVKPREEGPNDFWYKDDWQNTWDSAVGKSIHKGDPEGYVKSLGPDTEGFSMPDSDMLWLRKRALPEEKLEDLSS